MNFKKLFALAGFLLPVTWGYGQLSNDVCANAETVPAASDFSCDPISKTFVGAQAESRPDSCNGEASPAAYDQWFQFEAVRDTHIVDVETFAGDGFQQTGAVVVVYDACRGNIIGCSNPNLIGFGGFVFAQAGVTRVFLENLSAGNNYQVRVYNYGDTLPPPEQSDFTICVYSPAPVPENDSCSVAQLLAVNDSCEAVPGTVNGASQSAAAYDCGDLAASETAFDVWYQFNAETPNTIVRVAPANDSTPDLAPVIELYDDCEGSPIACAGPQEIPFFGVLPGTVTLNASGLSAATTYYVRVHHYGEERPLDGDFNICVFNAPPPPVNDTCTGATEVLVGDTCDPITGTLASANQESEPLLCDTTSPSAFDVWYRFEADQSTQIIEVSPQGGGFGDGVAPVIELYDACDGAFLDCAQPQVIPGFGAIPGVTTLETSDLTEGNSYWFRVYHFGDAVPDAPEISVCVYNPPPPPANDSCINATAITQAATKADCEATTATTIGATASDKSSSCDMAGMDDDVWFSFTATDSRAVAFVDNKSFDLFGSNMGFALYENDCNGAELNCLETTEADSAIFVNLAVGNTYLLRVFTDVDDANGDFDLCVYTPPAGPENDLCSGAITVQATTDETCNPTDGVFSNATQEFAPDSCGEYRSDNAFDIWYQFVALSESHVVEVTTPQTGGFQGGTGAVVEVYDACDGNKIACGNPTIIEFQGFEIVQAGTTTALAEDLTIDDTYYVRVYNYGDSLPPEGQEDFTICVKGPVAPVENDICVAAIDLPVNDSCVTTAGSLNGATEENPSVACEPEDASPSAVDVWYSFTAEASSQFVEVGPVAFSLNAIAPVIELFESCEGSPIACANPNITGFGAIPGTTVLNATGLTVGTTYYIRTYHYGDAAPTDGDFTVCIYNDPDLGISSRSVFAGTSIHPNPASHSLHITLGPNVMAGSVAYTVYNAAGAVVLQATSNNRAKVTLPVANLDAGMYSVAITNGKEHYRSKFIKLQ